MTTSSNPPLKTAIVYPDSDGAPVAESDATRNYLFYSVSTLNLYFQDRSDVYVSGNLFIYYQQGVPDAVVAPDVFVIFGVSKRQRMSYKTWEEGGKTPDFVMEITSKTTQDTDEFSKPTLYARLKVSEYFQYDPTGDYLRPQLKGARLVDGEYQPLPLERLAGNVVSIRSQVLGLDLRLLENGELRFFEPQTGRMLLSHEEEQQARQQEARERRAAVPRLLTMGLTVEQVASALNLPIEEVRKASPAP